jgi:hypothetical protein
VLLPMLLALPFAASDEGREWLPYQKTAENPPGTLSARPFEAEIDEE